MAMKFILLLRTTCYRKGRTEYRQACTGENSGAGTAGEAQSLLLLPSCPGVEYHRKGCQTTGSGVVPDRQMITCPPTVETKACGR